MPTRLAGCLQPPHAASQRPVPTPRTPTIHQPGPRVTRHHRGFTTVHPSGLPLTCDPRMEHGSLGSPPELHTPPSPAAHVGVGTGTWALARATSPSSDRPPSRSHSLRAPSWRTTQITIVVADETTFVEHLGNAGRPHAAVSRPIASLHRPSTLSRSYVLASLRALHLDRRLRAGALRAKKALTIRAHTGNARSILRRRGRSTEPASPFAQDCWRARFLADQGGPTKWVTCRNPAKRGPARNYPRTCEVAVGVQVGGSGRPIPANTVTRHFAGSRGGSSRSRTYPHALSRQNTV